MSRYVKHGFTINQHHLKGVYVSIIGKYWKQSTSPAEIICTLREVRDADSDSDTDPFDPDAKYGLISICRGGVREILRPWDPHTCFMAAAIHNHLINFPVRPGSCVFAIDCSLQTLSHIADIMSNNRRLIAVIDTNNEKRPAPEELNRFLRTYPGTSFVVDDIQNATLERYERLLSLPDASKYAFLMAWHPRLGAQSPARKLLDALEPPKLAQHIFDFLQYDDIAQVKCLVFANAGAQPQIEVIRRVVLSHIDIFKRWKTSARTIEPQASAADKEDGEEDGKVDGEVDGKVDGEVGGEADCKEDGRDDGKESNREDGKEDNRTPEPLSLRVLMNFLIVPNGASSKVADERTELTQALRDMMRLPSGLKTGLFAKEQLSLKPYFSNHLLLLKYSALHDERGRKPRKKTIRPPPGLEDVGGEPMANAAGGDPAAKAVRQRSTPMTNEVPMPAFSSSLGGGSKPRSPALAAPGLVAPGLVAPGMAALAAAAAQEAQTVPASVLRTSGVRKGHKVHYAPTGVQASDGPFGGCFGSPTTTSSTAMPGAPPPHTALSIVASRGVERRPTLEQLANRGFWPSMASANSNALPPPPETAYDVDYGGWDSMHDPAAQYGLPMAMAHGGAFGRNQDYMQQQWPGRFVQPLRVAPPDEWAGAGGGPRRPWPVWTSYGQSWNSACAGKGCGGGCGGCGVYDVSGGGAPPPHPQSVVLPLGYPQPGAMEFSL